MVEHSETKGKPLHGQVLVTIMEDLQEALTRPKPSLRYPELRETLRADHQKRLLARSALKGCLGTCLGLIPVFFVLAVSHSPAWMVAAVVALLAALIPLLRLLR